MQAIALYSHSVVAGGLLVRSRNTWEMFGSSLRIRSVTLVKNSSGRSRPGSMAWTVMKVLVIIGRSAIDLCPGLSKLNGRSTTGN